MKLLEMAQFLQEMANDNLNRHIAENPFDMNEISYHEGQLAVLLALIPRIPPEVEALENA